jgi:hypothetical protein
MTVLMHCGRHEGADVNLLNTDVDRIRVAPPTSSVAIMALHAFSRGSRSRLADGVTLPMSDFTRWEWKARMQPVTSLTTEEWGETQSNPDSYLRRSRPERAATRLFGLATCSHALLIYLQPVSSQSESPRSLQPSSSFVVACPGVLHGVQRLYLSGLRGKIPKGSGWGGRTIKSIPLYPMLTCRYA